jgi:hypothetical protein
MDPLADIWKSLGTPELTPELKRTIVDGVHKEAAGRSVEQLAADRDAMLLALQGVRANYATASEPSAQQAVAT